MKRVQRAADAISAHSTLVVVAFLLVSALVGAGLTQLETGSEFQQYQGSSDAANALAAIDADFAVGPQNTTTARVLVRDDDALDRETLVETLRFQRALRDNRTVSRTLVEERPTVGLANVLATAAYHRANPGAAQPTLDEQIAVLESLSAAQVDRGVAALLRKDAATGPVQPQVFVPTDHRPGAGPANATLVAVVQRTEGEPIRGQASDRIVAAQQAIGAIADDHDLGADRSVAGNGIITAERQRAQQESMQLLGPIALLLVLVTLSLAYRDVVDVGLGLLGIGLVLVWTFGTLGWVGIPFSPVFVAIPVLLIGLSIDYAIHVFMRYREERASGDVSARTAMARGLGGVGVALLWVTVTTGVGFLSTVVSPIGPMRDIGIISAIGIVSASAVFGVFVPALAVDVDRLLAWIGLDRSRRALGGDGGLLGSVLGRGADLAARSPVALLLVALLVTGGAAAGATQVDTAFEPSDFMPGDPPEWMEELPADVAPSDYQGKATIEYLQTHFASEDATGEVYVTGDITDPAVLERLDRAAEAAGGRATVPTVNDGSALVDSPVTVMRQVARRNDAFAARLAAADTDGDGLPDRAVADVYDRLFAVAPDAAGRVLHEEAGSYRAARLTVAVDEGALSQDVRADVRALADVVDGEGVDAVATGDPVVRANVQDELLSTAIQTLVLTLVAVSLLLVVAFRRIHGSATLGAVTVAPVVLVLAWIFGTMAVLGIPLSVLTALVASLTIGIGVDYQIHLSERYVQERAAGLRPASAIRAALTNTGAALTGSAVTTAGGFGVLALAILPMLRQFGLVTVLTVGYALVAAVLVLPSLLLVWDRWVGVPTRAREPSRSVAVADDD